MRELFDNLFNDIKFFYEKRVKDNPDDWGYEFLYNPEAACRKETKILLLTINPQAGKKRPPVDTPCPEEHAFFLQDNEFKIKNQLFCLFRELKKVIEPSSEDSEVNITNFASNHVIASSAVPFRTKSSGEITTDMWMFSRYLWSRIFKEWEPVLIIAVGYEAYNFVGAYFGFQYGALPEIPTNTEKAIVPRWIQFEKNDRTHITLAGFPHFSRYPAFTKNYDPSSPACSFLREVCGNSLLQQQ